MGKCAFRFLRLTLFLLAAVGLGLSAYLTYLHLLDMQGGAMPRLCGGIFDCSTVLQSPYALIAGAVPIAIFGVVYFTLLAIWIMFVGRLPGKLHHACLWPALLVTAGAIESAYLIYVMGWRLHAWCSFCLATHGVNFLMFAGVWTGWLAGCRHRGEEELAGLGQKQLWKVPVLTFMTGCCLALTVVFLAGMGAFAVKYTTTVRDLAKIQQDPDYQRWQYMRTASQAETLAVTAEDPVRGPATARHTLVMFGDFQCQYCAVADRVLHQVQEQIDSLRIIYKHYPQSQACNAAMAGSNKHAFACRAAEAAEAAYKLGGNEAFWQMHDALYEHQSRLAEKPYSELARQIGLDPVAFEQAMQDPAVRERVQKQAAIGKALNIPGTPVLFLDGRRVTLDIIMKDVTGNTPDVDKTVAHWRNLVAAAAEAAATQPVAETKLTPKHDDTATQ